MPRIESAVIVIHILDPSSILYHTVPVCTNQTLPYLYIYIVPMSYSGHYVNSHNSFPPPFHGNGGGYVESFGVPHLHTVHGGYGSGGFAVGPTQVMGGPVVGGGVAGGGPAVVGVDAAGNPVWGGEVYDTSRNQM